MAYQNKNMSVIAYANGWTMWMYRTTDSMTFLDEDWMYFPKQIVDLMAVGDVIYIVSKGQAYQRCVVEIKDGKALLGFIQ